MTSLSGPIRRTGSERQRRDFSIGRSHWRSTQDGTLLSQRRACFHRRFERWKMRTRFRFAVAIAIAMLTTGYARSASNQDAIPLPAPNPFRTVAPAPSPSKTAAQDAIPIPAPNPFKTAAPAPRRAQPIPRFRRRAPPRPRLRRRARPRPKLRQPTTTRPPPAFGRRPTIKAVPALGFCSSRRTGFMKGGSSSCSNSRDNSRSRRAKNARGIKRTRRCWA